MEGHGLARSTYTVICHWTYLAHESRWDAGSFKAIGLGGLEREQFRRVGTEVAEPGTALRHGLTEAARLCLRHACACSVASQRPPCFVQGVGGPYLEAAAGLDQTMTPWLEQASFSTSAGTCSKQWATSSAPNSATGRRV